MKKVVLTLLSFLLFFFACVEIEPTRIPVTSVILSATSIELEVGDSHVLTATVSPSDAENKTIIWTSSNASVATVDEGVITACKEGKATITVTTDEGGKTATCEVMVSRKLISVTEIKLDVTSAEMIEGDELQLNVTIIPDNATNKNVTWTTSNSSVASVSEGKVTALKPGPATIVATTKDGGKIATCEVAVSSKVNPVTSVTLDRTSAELIVGDELTLTATVNPENSTNKNVTWSSSNPSVASVSNGKVTALEAGRATIIVSSVDGGKTATCEVIVNGKTVPVTSVSLDRTSVELEEGEDRMLTATVNPENASNKNVTWSSSDPSVVSVVNGYIVALKTGRATITVKTEDGGKTATCEVTVNTKTVPVTSVSLDKTSVELIEGDVITLTATINPSNASNKNVTWSSSNPSVATVSNGKVTALKVGNATITVKTEDGDRIATCEVTVAEKEEDGDSNERLEENDGNW